MGTSADTLILIAALPVILICLYVYKKDVEKEPKTLLRKLMLWGVFSIIPIVIVEVLLGLFFETSNKESFLILFLNCFIGIGLIEELGKWIISYEVVYRDKEFNESYDAIVYSVFVSLGFALIENILYVLTNGVGVGLLRAFTSVPAHTCNGVLMGYFLSKTKIEEVNNNISKSKRNMFYSILIPALLHTMYDSLVFTENFNILIFLGFTAFLYIISILFIKKVSNNNVKFENSDVIGVDTHKNTRVGIIAVSGIIIFIIIIIKLIMKVIL